MTEGVERLLADGSPPMTPRRLLEELETLGISAETWEHAAVFTVQEARRERGSLEGAHTKNLFVRDKKGVMWLIVALEDRRIDLRDVATRLGHKRFSFGSEERLMRFLGLTRGSVTPFGVVNDRGHAVRVALDTGLQAHEVWNFHPLTNTMTTAIAGDDMLRFLASTGHEPTWIDLSA